MTSQPSSALAPDAADPAAPLIRRMTGADVDAAESIFRLAFGTEFGLADPFDFRRSARLVAGRFSMYPDGGHVAVHDGTVIGFSMASRWGSLGLLGPVCVHPRMWNRGVARRLVDRTVARIDEWRCKASGLFTNPSSPRHLRLYESFGYQPGHLVVILANDAPARMRDRRYDLLSQHPDGHAGFAAEAATLTCRAADGLDLRPEIAQLGRHGCGETLFSRGAAGLDWFAVCHSGPGSEAELGELYVKFAVVDGARDGEERIGEMIRSVLDYAAVMGLRSVSLGASVGRPRLYRTLLDHGFKGRFHGVLMHRPAGSPFERADSLILEDWR